MANSRRGRGQIRLRGARRHVLRGREGVNARVNVLIGATKAGARVRPQRTLGGYVHVAKTSVDLVDPTAHSGCGGLGLRQRTLCAGKLASSVRSAQCGSGFRGQTCPSGKPLVGSSDIRLESPYALLFGSPDGRLLGRGEACNLVAGELLGKSRLKSEFLRLFEQLELIRLDFGRFADDLLLN